MSKSWAKSRCMLWMAPLRMVEFLLEQARAPVVVLSSKLSKIWAPWNTSRAQSAPLFASMARTYETPSCSNIRANEIKDGWGWVWIRWMIPISMRVRRSLIGSNDVLSISMKTDCACEVKQKYQKELYSDLNADIEWRTVYRLFYCDIWAIYHRPLTMFNRPSTIDHRPSTIDHRPSTIITLTNEPSAINHQPSTIRSRF